MPIINIYNQAGKVHFEIREGKGQCVATSLKYRTICGLEVALASLYKISLSPSDVVVNARDGRYQVSSKESRQRLALSEIGSTQDFLSVLVEISDAQVIDSRPRNRRRTDLEGPLKSLI